MSDYIPREIVIKILKLLPVRSLVRFRSVCQWMNRVIESPSFIQDHLALQKPRFVSVYRGQELLVVNPHTPSMATSLLDRRFESERVNLVGTLHGIVCFYSYDRHFMLSNISIRKSLILPLPDFTKPAVDDYYDGRSVFSGFWIDPRTKDFKIVTFTMISPVLDAVNDAILYSSTTQDWKPLVPSMITMFSSLSPIPAVVIEKVGYWRFFQTGAVYDENEDEFPWLGTESFIVSFDFEREVFYMTSALWVRYTLAYPPVLSRWRDTLSLVFVDDYDRCDAYFREARGTEEVLWIRKFSFSLTDVIFIRCLLSMVEFEGQETDSAQILQENRRVLAATDAHELVLCDNEPAYRKFELEDAFTLSVAYDFVDSLLFPQV